jgi:hypothetical protein
MLRHKAPFLNTPFFLGRAIYFAGWILLSWLLNRRSLERGPHRQVHLGLGTTRIAAPGLIFWIFSVTFLSIDWAMSVNPHWFSTITACSSSPARRFPRWRFMITVLVMMSASRPFPRS